jgi:hypothetical protein
MSVSHLLVTLAGHTCRSHLCEVCEYVSVPRQRVAACVTCSRNHATHFVVYV